MSKLPARIAREVAVRASVDPRTVQRVLGGQPVRGLTGERIAKVLAEMGIEVKRETDDEGAMTP